MRLARRWLTGGLAALLMLMAGIPAMAENTFTRVPGLDRVKAVAAAGDHFSALRADGSVWTWNGHADGEGAAKPQQVTVGCPVRALASGADRMALLCANGSVWTVSIAITESGVRRAVQAPGLDSVKAVAMGRSGLVALRTDGTVWVAEIAINEQGVHRAVRVPEVSGVTAVAAGMDDFVALLADGTAWRLAINTQGTSVKRLAEIPPARTVAVCGPGGDCDDTDPYVFVTVDGKVLATVMSTGDASPVAVGDLDGDGYIAAGHGRILSVTPTGDARMALLSTDAKVTVSNLKRPGPALKQVAAGGRYDVGLAADGTVWMWAAPRVLSRVPGLEQIRALASGDDWHLALAADGKLYCWGSNDSRRTHVVPHVFEVSRIAAAPGYYVTLNTDGSIAAGTCPDAGAPPAAPSIKRDLTARDVAAGTRHVLIVRANGQGAAADIAIDEEGVHFSEFRNIPGVVGAVQAAAGETGYLFLRDDGTVWGARWGSSPVQVKAVAGARAVAAGGDSFAVTLGDGTVLGIAIDETGVHIWGDPHVDESDAIAAGSGGGSGRVVVLRADGAVAAFSRTVGAGQVTDLLDGIAVSAGGKENVVLKGDGTVWTWRSGGR